MVKTKKRFVCEECEKELKSKRALVGHMWFAHGKRTGEKASLYDNIKTLEKEKGTNPDTIERLEKIERHVEKLVETADDIALKLANRPTNPGSPGKPGDPNPEKVKSDEKEDSGLPDIITPVLKFFGLVKEKKSDDDEKKSEKPDDDDNSWFL